MAYHDFMIELEGTPDEVQAMLNVASKIERGCYKKQRINPGLYRVWYHGEDIGQPNDLVARIRRDAGLNKPRKGKEEAEAE